MYINLHKNFDKNQTILKYSKTETINELKDISHPIFREVLSSLKLPGLDISSIADIPSGTGMGSSSTFTVALVNAVYSFMGIHLSKDEIASLACDIEINRLGEPIGKQDQYAAAIGGLNFIEFETDGTVRHNPVLLSYENSKRLQNNLYLFYTGQQRSASSVLSDQKKQMSSAEKRFIVDGMCDLAKKMRIELERQNIGCFGELLDAGWSLKSKVSEKIASGSLKELYNRAIQAGASGGKLLGAGGGGFFLFYVEEDNQEYFERNFTELDRLPFQFENDGVKVIFHE
jgi:D-glycero-alpha-D-manno-heptose-7-phosphate kinase